MSHPAADPALAAAAARLVGMSAAMPATSRIVEIGCGCGHHLIALALRWPGAECVGVDVHPEAIRRARHMARLAGAKNVRFIEADIADFDSEPGPHDYILAHGVFSWLPAEARSALLPWIRQRLAPQGLAVVSHNVMAGWQPRLRVIQKARAVRQLGAKSWQHALALLREVALAESDPGSDLAIIDDMLAKPPGVLEHDDFCPTMEPCSHGQFVAAARGAGLRWIGSPQVSDTLPAGVSPDQAAALRDGCATLDAWLDRLDVASMNCFRVSMLVRDDLSVRGTASPRDLMDLAVRCLPGVQAVQDPQLHDVVAGFAPSCVAISQLLGPMLPTPPEDTLRRVIAAAQQGWLQVRIEEQPIDPIVPLRPQLSAFRLACARRRLPLVDAWQVSCAFPEHHADVLALMDGSRDLLEIRAAASRRAPELQLEPWLQHLAGRGMFA